MMNGGGGETSAGSLRGGGAVAGRRCEDCGNQAKRECRYWRCRRCCRRRKLECQTHVSSTWVPTSLRRLQQAAARGSSTTHPSTSHQQHHVLLHHHHHIPSDLESENFPGEVTSMATFHCCKVRSLRLDGGRNHGDDDRLVFDEYAYRTSVSIGGHLFNGILYDQGPQSERRQSSATAGVVLAPLPPLVPCTFPLPTLHTQ